MTNTAPDDLAQRIAALSPAKRAMLEQLLQRKQAVPAGASTPSAIPRRANREEGPLSFAQQRLWFLDQLEPGSSLYNMSRQIRIQGPLDVATLERALDQLVARQDSLRTAFPDVNGEPRQVIGSASAVHLEVTNLETLRPEEREPETRRLFVTEARRPFDLAHGPLFRARLLRLSPEEHLLIMVLHHIIGDDWSIGVLFNELGTMYTAFAAGTEPVLPALPVQYADYAAWQREWLQGPVLAGQLAYWKKHFAGSVARLELPGGGAVEAAPDHAGAAVPVTILPELTERLQALSRQEGATMFMTVLAAFQCLLARYSGLDDIVLGTPIAGRTRTELEPLIGFFVNTLVLRTDLSGDPSFRTILERTREVALGAYANQDLPFERLVQELQPERDLGRNPLFDVVFALHNAPRSFLELSGVTLSLVGTEPVSAKFDLALVLGEKAGGLRGALHYSSGRLDRETVEQMVTHFGTLLEGIAANPDERLSRLPLLTDGARRAAVIEWNQGEPVPDGDPRAHRLFEDHATRTPDAAALIAPGRRLTYGELNHRANRLARRLRASGVGPDVRVGLMAERSPELFVGLLGILKAGGAYVPLDPNYPSDRLSFMLGDSGARILVATPGLVDRTGIAPASLPMLIELTEGDLPASDVPESITDAEVDGNHLAYVMYTSGSTGTPKGVGIPHQAVASFARGAAREYALGPADRVLQFASISFDLSVDEIFPTWAAGGAIALPAPGPLSPREVSAMIEQEGVTVASLPTAFWHTWVQELQDAPSPLPDSLRLLIVGGEKVQAAAYAAWRGLRTDHIRWLNTYGPTETTVEATAWQAAGPGPARAPDSEIPIGRPVAGARVYVLDRHLNPVPRGVAGELFIGGPGVARGYLGRPALTALAFLPDPFAPDGGARMYRTGDLVRHRPDGELEFIGRADRQVKIRGYRVEPGEVESALSQHPGVANCAIVAAPDVVGGKRLVAYATAAASPAPDLASVREFLADRLPDHMLPAALMVLPALPLTPNGKVDRRALPPPDDMVAEPTTTHRPADTPTEETIAGIWQQVLGVTRVGATDNFFALGGHSLLATQVIARVRSAFGLELPLRVLFEAPTVAGLAERVDAGRRLLHEIAGLSGTEVRDRLADGRPGA